MDLSEQCGYTVEVQCKLFHSIKLLSNGKPIMLVLNKVDDEDARSCRTSSTRETSHACRSPASTL